MTYTCRPNPLYRSTTTASTSRAKKMRSERGKGPSRGCWPRASNHAGNSLMERSSTSTRARPRNPISIARVTTRDGRPTTVTQNPLNAPPRIPMKRQARIAAGMGTPCCTSQPRAQAESPIIDATERSISAFRMTKVMMRATMTFSIERAKRLTWFSVVRKDGEVRAFIAMMQSSSTARKPSQLRTRSPSAAASRAAGAGRPPLVCVASRERGPRSWLGAFTVRASGNPGPGSPIPPSPHEHAVDRDRGQDQHAEQGRRAGTR